MIVVVDGVDADLEWQLNTALSDKNTTWRDALPTLISDPPPSIEGL